MPKIELPTRKDLAHIPFAGNYWFDGEELDLIWQNAVTAVAKIEPHAYLVERWGREFRRNTGVGPEIEVDWYGLL